VSENIFSQYMYKTLPTCNQLWLFKKYFCSQMALSGEFGSVTIFATGFLCSMRVYEHLHAAAAARPPPPLLTLA
jgi:hypothetical protein